MDSLKIAYLDLNQNLGGGHIALCNMIYSLSKKGHEVHAILGLDELPMRIQKICLNNCTFHLTYGLNRLTEFNSVKSKITEYFTQLHKKNKYDVIVGHGLNSNFVPSFLREKLITVIHGNTTKRGLSLINSLFKEPNMMRPAIHYKRNIFNNIFGNFWQSSYEISACNNSKIIVTLTPTEKYYAKKYYFVHEDKIRIIPNIIMNSVEDKKIDAEFLYDKKIVLSVGSLEFIKGVPILIKSMQHILRAKKDVIFISVGNGPLFPLLKTLKEMFPEQVVLYPHISEGLFSLYNLASVFLHCSFFEAFGLSIGEAMLAAKPVIAFRTTSIPHLVTDNVTGYLAELGSIKEITEKTLFLLEDEKTVKKMGEAARSKVEKLYNPNVVGETMEHVLKEACN